MTKVYEDTIIELQISAEIAEVIGGLGFDTEGYFKQIMKELEKRYAIIQEKKVIDENIQAIDDEVARVKEKNKVIDKNK